MGRKGACARATIVALAAAAAVAADDGDRITRMHARGIRLATSNDFERALPIFEDIVKLSPVAQHWNNLGVTLMRMNRPGEAVEVFAQCFKASPGHRDCTNNMKDLRPFAAQHGVNVDGILAGSAPLKAPYSQRWWLTSPLRSEDAGEDDDEEGAEEGEEGEEGEEEEEGGEEAAEQPPRRRGARDSQRPPAHQLDEQARRRFLPVHPSQLKHRVRPLPRVHVSQLYNSTAAAQYARSLRPFVITGIMETPEWRATTAAAETAGSVSDLSALAARFPDTTVDYYPHNMETESVKPTFHRLPAALADLKGEISPLTASAQRSRASNARYLQWNMQASDWRRIMRLMGPLPPLLTSDEPWLDACMADDAVRSDFFVMTHWRMIIIGTREAGMFNHKDSLKTSSWQLQVAGGKRWHLCGPEEDGNMYEAGRVNAFNPDYAAFPAFANATCYLDVVTAGEAIFYPIEYWHQTFNEATPSAAVTGTLIDAGNYRHVQREVMLEMGFVELDEVDAEGWRVMARAGTPEAGARKSFNRFTRPNAALESALLNCTFPAWHIMYGGGGLAAFDGTMISAPGRFDRAVNSGR